MSIATEFAIVCTEVMVDARRRDEILERLRDSGREIVDISWEGQGCSISQASTSVLTDQVIGQTVDEALKTVGAFTEMISSRGNVEGDEDVLGDGIAFAGVAKYPARVKCALLGWHALMHAIADNDGQAVSTEEEGQP